MAQPPVSPGALRTGDRGSRGRSHAALADRLPRNPTTWCRLLCLATGPFLLLDGLGGLIFAPTAFSVGDHLPREDWNFLFQFNGWHNALHIVNGAVLTAGAVRRSWSAPATLLFGLSYAVMAPVGFIDGDDVFNLFYSGTRENLVHTFFALEGVFFGSVGLAAAAASRRAAL